MEVTLPLTSICLTGTSYYCFFAKHYEKSSPLLWQIRKLTLVQPSAYRQADLAVRDRSSKSVVSTLWFARGADLFSINLFQILASSFFPAQKLMGLLLQKIPMKYPLSPNLIFCHVNFLSFFSPSFFFSKMRTKVNVTRVLPYIFLESNEYHFLQNK